MEAFRKIVTEKGWQDFSENSSEKSQGTTARRNLEVYGKGNSLIVYSKLEGFFGKDKFTSFNCKDRDEMLKAIKQVYNENSPVIIGMYAGLVLGYLTLAGGVTAKHNSIPDMNFASVLGYVVGSIAASMTIGASAGYAVKNWIFGKKTKTAKELIQSSSKIRSVDDILKEL
jgi:hypothetical protein